MNYNLSTNADLKASMLQNRLDYFIKSNLLLIN